MFLVPFDDWTALFFMKVYHWYFAFFNYYVVGFFEMSVLKEVRSLRYLQRNITNTCPNLCLVNFLKKFYFFSV